MTGDPIVLVNRTPAELTFTADGREHRLLPGDNPGFLSGHAPFAMNQNPLNGTEDRNTLAFVSKVGVKGVDDCSPLDAETLEIADAYLERLDRRTVPSQGTVKTFKGVRAQKGRIAAGGMGETLAYSGRG